MKKGKTGASKCTFLRFYEKFLISQLNKMSW